MARDPLEKWRRPGSQPAAEPEATPGRNKVEKLENYRSGGDAAESSGSEYSRAMGWVEFRPKKGTWEFRQYAQLRGGGYNGGQPTRLDVIFADMVVTIEGEPQQLRAVRTGVRSRSLAYVVEKNADALEDLNEDERKDVVFVNAIKISQPFAGRL